MGISEKRSSNKEGVLTFVERLMIDSQGSFKQKPGSATIFSSYFYFITLIFLLLNFNFKNNHAETTPLLGLRMAGSLLLCCDNVLEHAKRRLHFGLCDQYTVGDSNS